MINVTLMGPDKALSIVQISEGATVRDVAAFRYHLFWRTTGRNGVSIDPFSTGAEDGDNVTVERE